MPRLKLTARGVENLSTDKPREEFWDTITPGLLLRVSGETGRKTWYVRYRVNGTRRRQKLGTFPALELSKARDDARDVMRKADAGEDPAQEREERKRGDHTFKALAEEVLEARALRTRAKTQKERKRILEKELLPAWGDRTASSVTRREVVQLVEKMATRGAEVVANRTLSLIHLLFNDGLRRGFPGIEANPAHLVQPPTDESGRDRFLELDEIRKVWTALDGENPSTRAIFRLALLTGQRIGAVRAMRWPMVSADVWRIPAADFKGKREHLVPLSPAALEVLEELRELEADVEWVFPSRAGAKVPHVANTAGSLDRIRKRAKIPHWTAHDFRTTFRTHATRSDSPEPGEAGGLGIPGPVADAVLGHKDPSLGFSHYTGDKERYLIQEKREALRKWGEFITQAVEVSR